MFVSLWSSIGHLILLLMRKSKNIPKAFNLRSESLMRTVFSAQFIVQVRKVVITMTIVEALDFKKLRIMSLCLFIFGGVAPFQNDRKFALT